MKLLKIKKCSISNKILPKLVFLVVKTKPLKDLIKTGFTATGERSPLLHSSKAVMPFPSNAFEKTNVFGMSLEKSVLSKFRHTKFRHPKFRHARFRHVFGIILLPLMAMLLSGCQPLAIASSLSPPASPLPTTSVEITLWHGGNPPANREVLDDLVAQFNHAHPEIHLTALYIGQEDQQPPKILSAVVGNVPPDLLWYAPTMTGRLVELDAILPLEAWLSDRHLLDQIDPALLDTMRWEDHLWSAPFGTNNVGIFYRPSLFQAAGITGLPQSWSEFRTLARQLTLPQADPPQFGMLLPLGKGEWTVFMWLPFLWSAGGDLFDQDGNLNLVTPAAIAALQFWQDLVKDGSAILSQPERGYDLTRLLTGQVAMQLTGPWTLRQLNAIGVDYAVMPIPGHPHTATSLGGENLFVFKTDPRRQQAALEFLQTVLSEEFQTQWALGTGYLPVNPRSRQSEEYQAFIQENPALEVFLTQAERGRSRPISPNYNRLSDALGRAIEAVLLGKQSPIQALEDAQHRLERLGIVD